MTEKIVNNCRQNETTVNGAICAAMLMAVTDHIRNIRNQKYLKITASCRIGADVRKLVNPKIEPEQLGFIVSSLISLHRISYNHDFWDLAKEVTQQVKQKIASREILFNLLVLAENFNSIVNSPDKLVNTVDVTNVGKVQIRDNYGKFQLEEINFIASNRMISRSMMVAVTTFKQQMVLNFATSEPSVSQLTRETLANNVVKYLTKYSIQ